MWPAITGILGGCTIAGIIWAVIHWDTMNQYRCGTTESWTLAPCIRMYCKVIEGWADYIMHYPIITDREDYVGRWVICKKSWFTSAGKMNRWGIHRAGECPHSMYRTIDEHRGKQKCQSLPSLI